MSETLGSPHLAFTLPGANRNPIAPTWAAVGRASDIHFHTKPPHVAWLVMGRHRHVDATAATGIIVFPIGEHLDRHYALKGTSHALRC